MANLPKVFGDGISTGNETLVYDEGVWTPTIVSTGGGTATYTNQIGRYTRIGNVVHCQFLVSISAHTGSGTMSVGGLPFTAKNVAGIYAHACSFDFGSLTVPANSIVIGYIAPNTEKMDLESYAVGGSSTSLLTLDTAFSLYGAFTYLIQ